VKTDWLDQYSPLVRTWVKLPDDRKASWIEGLTEDDKTELIESMNRLMVDIGGILKDILPAINEAREAAYRVHLEGELREPEG
jgi:hypothetical protein